MEKLSPVELVVCRLGKKVVVKYAKDQQVPLRGLSGSVSVAEKTELKIVTLLDYDPATKEITYRCKNGKVDKRVPLEVFVPS